MRFEKLDLNLLIVLDALLRDRSVSAAADRINLSQSATSSALARLRLYFEDDLLVMRGRGMALTPRAVELIDPVASVLAQIRETIATPKRFDPGTSDRRLTVMTSDYSTEVLLAPTLRGIAGEAISMTFQLLPMTDDFPDQLERGAVDLVIAPDSSLSTEHPSAHLFSDTFVVVGWLGNELLDQAMTMDLYSDLGHVATRFGRLQVPSFEEWVHRHRAISRRVEIAAANFVSVATLVSGSRRIGTMHRRLAERLANQYELRVMEPPFEVPQVRIAAQWLSNAARDPAISWFVERLRAHSPSDSGQADVPPPPD